LNKQSIQQVLGTTDSGRVKPSTWPVPTNDEQIASPIAKNNGWSVPPYTIAIELIVAVAFPDERGPHTCVPVDEISEKACPGKIEMPKKPIAIRGNAIAC
jgi:hypothetical protein